jgi:hypothetical protein
MLVGATGSRTPDPVFSMHTDSAAVRDVMKARNMKVQSAKGIVIDGGGPTGVESTGEIGELRNGLPDYFGSSSRNANITLITSANQLIPHLRPALGALTETKLRNLVVDVVYNSRVVDVLEGKNGRTAVTSTGVKKMDVDLYIPAHGVSPNSSSVPATLLTEHGYVKKRSADTPRRRSRSTRVFPQLLHGHLRQLTDALYKAEAYSVVLTQRNAYGQGSIVHPKCERDTVHAH